ncbi:MAG: thioredoxin family protein [Actinobacteria bacterium]|nr:thioredoxin family protein [Actinomycetota bacterium]
MNIKILGPGCNNCIKLERLVREAVAELGLEASIDKITDFSAILSYGVMRTPGLVVDEEVKVSGRVPDKSEIVTILTTVLAK